MAFELRFGFILSCFGGREVKNKHGFFALAGDQQRSNLFQLEANNLNSIHEILALVPNSIGANFMAF